MHMLEAGADDPCPEVALEACAGLRALVAALGRRLGPAAKTLGWAFIPNLTHKCALGALSHAQPAAAPLAAADAARARSLSRSLTLTARAALPLCRRSKVRVAAIEAVTPLLVAGAHECILDLTGFRSPNVVPIKAFYGDDMKARPLLTCACRQTHMRTTESLRS